VEHTTARVVQPVDGRSLAVARIVFGAIGVLSAARLVGRGWVTSLLVDPEVHLRYPGLAWIPVPPPTAIWVLVAIVAASSIAVALGWHYRIAIAAFLVAFTWVELIESTMYLNHYWFMTLAGALMAVLPMSARWSLDAHRRGDRSVPLGAVWLLRAQIAAVYLGAGIAKLHGDWLVHGLPLGLWLPARAHLPVVGPLLEHPGTAIAASWAGALFDCTVVGFLLWRRTRLVAWLVVVTFHLVTWLLFPVIGVFPWLMIGLSTVFFDPDWPRAIIARFGAAPVGTSRLPDLHRPTATPTKRRLLAAAVVVWILVQVALPLRHLAYPGDHRWTGEGYRFGWNVMLVEKAGAATFELTDPRTGERSRTAGDDLFTPAQLRVLTTDPELLRQAAHALAARTAASGRTRPEVRVDASVSLNGRPAARLVDPTVDLAAEPWRPGPQRWILAAPTTPPPG
jgi:hypothetical protein